MSCKKNWFYNLIVLFAGLLALYAFAVNFMGMSAGTENGVICRAGIMAVMFIIVAATMLVAWIYNRFGLDKYIGADKKWMKYIEKAVLVGILLAAVIIRINVINGAELLSGESESLYYEMAGYLNQGTLRTEGAHLGEYIAENPGAWAYAVMLSGIFSVAGVSARSGLYLNVLFAVLGIWCLGYIARKLSGRVGALVVLVWSTFMPQAIQSVLDLSPELATGFFMLTCGAVAVHTLMDFGIDKGRPGTCFAWNIFLGVLLAISVIVNPVMIFFAVALIVVIVIQKMEMPGKPLNDIPLLLRAIGKGWIRCILIILPFVLIYAILFTNIEMAINKDVNAIDYLVSMFVEFFANSEGLVAGITSIFAGYEQIWRSTGTQGVATLCTLLTAILGLWGAYKRKGNFIQIFVLFYVMAGTTAYIWTVLIVLAGHGVQGIFEDAADKQAAKLGENELQKIIDDAKTRELEAYKNVEEEVARIREEALANVFDMNYALEHGHVIMTVSEAYGKDNAENKGGE